MKCRDAGLKHICAPDAIMPPLSIIWDCFGNHFEIVWVLCWVCLEAFGYYLVAHLTKTSSTSTKWNALSFELMETLGYFN